MPVLSASALDTHPESLALLRQVLRPERDDQGSAMDDEKQHLIAALQANFWRAPERSVQRLGELEEHVTAFRADYKHAA